MNPWNLPKGQEQALEALVKAGCEKRAAAELGVSRNTINTHLGRAKQKMGAATQLQAALLWDRFVGGRT